MQGHIITEKQHRYQVDLHISTVLACDGLLCKLLTLLFQRVTITAHFVL